jgi:hypothetical protein
MRQFNQVAQVAEMEKLKQQLDAQKRVNADLTEKLQVFL